MVDIKTSTARAKLFKGGVNYIANALLSVYCSLHLNHRSIHGKASQKIRGVTQATAYALLHISRSPRIRSIYGKASQKIRAVAQTTAHTLVHVPRSPLISSFYELISSLYDKAPEKLKDGVNTMANALLGNVRSSRTRSIYDKEVQAVLFQVIFLLLVLAAGYFLYSNMQANLERQNIQTGFDYLSREAGFDIGESWISYSAASTYSRAVLVGFINTAVVAIIGIVLATLMGIFVGVASLSNNWLARQLTGVYINFLRNIPVLLQIILWYTLITSPRFLPTPRDFRGDDGLEPFLGMIYMTRQGIFLPSFEAHIGWLGAAIGLVIGIIGAVFVGKWTRQRMEETGEQLPTFWIAAGVIALATFIGWLVMGAPTAISYPIMGRFRFAGGSTISPEFMAVLFGLTIYTSAFIADIVRSGILSVSKGQVEAGRSLGLREGLIMYKIILPQALRVIIPPLTSQYLNLTKNSSLAVAVGYPDLVNVSNTTLNQTGQAPEAILIMMIVYLSTSLATSLFMNWYNTQIKLVER